MPVSDQLWHGYGTDMARIWHDEHSCPRSYPGFSNPECEMTIAGSGHTYGPPVVS